MDSREFTPQSLPHYRVPEGPVAGSVDIQLPHRSSKYGFGRMKVFHNLRLFGLERQTVNAARFYAERKTALKAEGITSGLVRRTLDQLFVDGIISMDENVDPAMKNSVDIRIGPHYFKARVVNETVNSPAPVSY